MDGVSVIGLAASIVGIVDVATKNISALRKLQERWKSAELTVGVLIGQLTTVKAALDQISTWISTISTDSPHHHRLVIDLEAAVQSCKLCVSLLDKHLTKLDWDTSHRLGFESKVKTVLKDCDMKEYANHLSNQSIALNLLLTALTWYGGPLRILGIVQYVIANGRQSLNVRSKRYLRIEQ